MDAGMLTTCGRNLGKRIWHFFSAASSIVSLDLEPTHCRIHFEKSSQPLAAKGVRGLHLLLSE